ncbi:MAG: efflux transporter periplasmic adaptor subunit, partial [Gammaproteobacteria bacterium]|nr:efflux transporter periplasmic adaptor subunit [Gammaproteobacteria bacterium]
QKAVLEGPQGKFVYVVGKGEADAIVAEFRPVEVGEWTSNGGADRNWVILKGLNAGDQVILDNLIKVRPGAPVQIAEPMSPATTAETAQSPTTNKN